MARRRITCKRGRVQGRGHLDLRARRRQYAGQLGRRACRTRWCRSSTDFKGESAHAAAAPWRGRSALDAVELMDIGWNFRREHLRLQQRSHYVIPNGGDQPNVVPPNASVWYYFRETDYPNTKALWDDRRHDGEGRHDDDEHRGVVAAARLGVVWPFQQDDRRNDVREHREGGAAAVDRGGSDARQGAAARVEGAGDRPGDEDSAAAGPRRFPTKSSAAEGPTTSATSRGTCRR